MKTAVTEQLVELITSAFKYLQEEILSEDELSSWNIRNNHIETTALWHKGEVYETYPFGL
jgi:hypothetical protein